MEKSTLPGFNLFSSINDAHEITSKITGQEIEFFDECYWTADFDWTYILSGKFTFSADGDEILIWRNYDVGTRDMYKLTRE